MSARQTITDVTAMLRALTQMVVTLAPVIQDSLAVDSSVMVSTQALKIDRKTGIML